MARRGLEGFADDIAGMLPVFRQRSPAHAAVLEVVDALLAAGELGALEAAWRERSFEVFYDRPLLLLASLRLQAQGDPQHPLRSALGVEPADPGAAGAERVLGALARPGLAELLATRAVQTNETSRAVAWLLPRSLVPGRPVALVDIGCSAGLNLVGDRLPDIWTDESGSPLPLPGGPVTLRLGLDRAPLDVRREQDRLWLRACIWPGQVDRMARFEAAVSVMETTDAALETCEVGGVPARIERLLSGLAPEVLVLAYQTLMREYLSEATLARYADEMGRLLRGAASRLAWVELETFDAGAALPAAITVHASSGDHLLARCHWHPARVDVDGGAREAVRRALAW